MESDNRIPVQILGVKQIMDNETVVLLQEEDPANDGRVLPIFIGAFESQAIELGLKGVETPRPLTHDLMQIFIEEFDAVVIAVEIVDMSERTYFADIIVARNPELGGMSSQGTLSEDIEAEEHIRISARPSDAIALAVRVDCPVFVLEKLMDEGAFKLETAFTVEEGFSDDLEKEPPETNNPEDSAEGSSEDSVEDIGKLLDQFNDFISEVTPKDFEKMADNGEDDLEEPES